MFTPPAPLSDLACAGIVKASIALPDVHSGYGFAIGNVAAFDMSNPDSIVSPGLLCDACLSNETSLHLTRLPAPPGGVGFDINCGVRLLRTNLVESDVAEVRRLLQKRLSAGLPVEALTDVVDACTSQVKEKLAQSLFDHIPVGVGSQGIIPTSAAALESALSMGMDW